MTEEIVKAIFLLAEIPVKKLYQLANAYWPDVPDYAERRSRDPWWLVQTEWGMIRIGWRKRVIHIDWLDTTIRAEVTKDEVTKGKEMVHAWGYAKAVQYLSNLKYLAENPPAELTEATTANAT